MQEERCVYEHIRVVSRMHDTRASAVEVECAGEGGGDGDGGSDEGGRGVGGGGEGGGGVSGGGERGGGGRCGEPPGTIGRKAGDGGGGDG